MSTWQRRERTTAKAFCTRRVVRSVGESAPDVEPVTLPSGEVLSIEVKHRRRIPALIGRALEQAARYAPAAVPLAVISQHGGRQLVCIALDAFARLVGITSPEIPAAPKRRPRAPKRPKQVPLPGM